MEKVISEKCHLHGFMSINSPELLQQTIQKDLQTIESYGISLQQIQDYLQKLRYHIRYASVEISHGRSLIFQGRLIVKRRHDPIMNRLVEDPFDSTRLLSTDDWYFIKPAESVALQINESTWDHIMQHGFFHGIGTSYRIHPDRFIEFFHLKPSINYQTEIQHLEEWKIGEYNFIDKKKYKGLINLLPSRLYEWAYPKLQIHPQCPFVYSYTSKDAMLFIILDTSKIKQGESSTSLFPIPFSFENEHEHDEHQLGYIYFEKHTTDYLSDQEILQSYLWLPNNNNEEEKTPYPVRTPPSTFFSTLIRFVWG